MSYKAEVYNVMIASPGDVNTEREIAREVILDWNNINSFTRKIVLAPISWEYNTVPASGDRAQAIIDQQILQNADILVGIFWTRCGTPTGKALSGSVEEIEEHILSGKDAMLYFSKAPADLDKVDPDQYALVKKLKSEFQQKGLTTDYDSSDDFREKFQRHLSMKLNDQRYFLHPDSPAPTSAQSSSLSEKASTLLIECSKDPAGQITYESFGGGEFLLQTNDQQLNADSTPRTRAAWEAALKELLNAGLIQDAGTKGEVFEMTNKGYSLAEKMSDAKAQ
jgi:hypothetical protein